MKTLKQFLEESLTNPYPYKKTKTYADGKIHRYRFNDHKNRSFTVDFFHSGDKAEISFEDRYGSTRKTGESGKHAVRIFSTIRDMMSKHAKDHPDLNTYEFSAIKPGHPDEDSKARLYKRLAKTYGGDKTGEDEYFHKFEIPIKR